MFYADPMPCENNQWDDYDVLLMVLTWRVTWQVRSQYSDRLTFVFLGTATFGSTWKNWQNKN